MRRVLMHGVLVGFMTVYGAQAWAEAEPEPTPLKEVCEKKNGVWMVEDKKNHLPAKCILPAKDAGQSCTDGNQCESGFCMALTLCGDKAAGAAACHEAGRCYSILFPPKGCFDFMHSGKSQTICTD